MARKKLTVDVRAVVLHEAGYLCGNPRCRRPLTLDIHHLDPVSKGGPDTPENLLALCPNCHADHHSGIIPIESLRAWKMLLLAVNEAYDRRSVDILLSFDKHGPMFVSGDGVLSCAALIAGGMVLANQHVTHYTHSPSTYHIGLTRRGQDFVKAWKGGDQDAAIRRLDEAPAAVQPKAEETG